jgi:hypothetical protein
LGEAIAAKESCDARKAQALKKAASEREVLAKI